MAKDFEIEATPPKAGRVSASRGYMKVFGENPYVHKILLRKIIKQSRPQNRNEKSIGIFFLKVRTVENNNFNRHCQLN